MPLASLQTEYATKAAKVEGKAEIAPANLNEHVELARAAVPVRFTFLDTTSATLHFSQNHQW